MASSIGPKYKYTLIRYLVAGSEKRAIGTGFRYRLGLQLIARQCIPVLFGASRSEDLRLDRVGKAPALCGSRPSRHLRGYESTSSWITLPFMDLNLCRRLMPRPKSSRSHPTAAATAPATLRMVHLQVIGREHMTIAADIGYGHGLEHTFQGKAHHMSFGCFKARPRYQCCINATIRFSELRRQCWCTALPTSRLFLAARRSGAPRN